MFTVYNVVALAGEDEDYCEVVVESFKNKADAEAYRELHCDSHLPQYVVEGVPVELWWTDKNSSEEVWCIEEVTVCESLEEAE